MNTSPKIYRDRGLCPELPWLHGCYILVSYTFAVLKLGYFACLAKQRQDPSDGENRGCLSSLHSSVRLRRG
jgi:hypothetical protein